MKFVIERTNREKKSITRSDFQDTEAGIESRTLGIQSMIPVEFGTKQAK